MASEFSDVSVQKISIATPAALPEEAVRKQEFDAAIAARPTTAAMNAALNAVAHPAATGGDTNGIATTVNGSQQVSSSLIIPAPVVTQAADTGLEEIFEPIADGDSIQLAKVSVSSVVVIKRVTADESLVHTGVEDVDYYLDAFTGEIRILSADLATDAGEEIFVTYDCAEVATGPGVKVESDGVKADFGVGGDQVPSGRDVAELMTKRHRPVTLSPDNESVEGSIDDRQELKLEVKLATDSGLTKTGGLKVDTSVIATKSSVDALDTRVDAVETALNGLDLGTPTTVEDTNSIALTRDENGKITADITADEGIQVTETGVGVDFAVVATKTTTDDHENRISAAESAITGLQEDKADAAAVQAALDGKSDVGHGHAISDVTDLQTELDGKSPIDHAHDAATAEAAGYLSSEDFQALQCLKVVGDEEGAARELFPTLRQEIPEESFQQNPEVHEAKSIQVGGTVGTNYTVRLKVRGVFETKGITGGTPVSGGKAVDGGSPAATPHNLASLTISAPAKTYYLNPVQSNGLEVLSWDYELVVVVTGGATVTLAVDSIDAQHLSHEIQGPEDVVPYPEVFEGQFLQVDAIKVDGYCLLEREFRDGVDHSDGTGGLDGDGGGGPTDGLEGANSQAVSIPDQLRRVDFLPSIGTDGDVQAIRIHGEDVWIGGAFDRYGNIRSRGLAKLDPKLRYRYNFALGAGFSEPVKCLAVNDAATVVAAELDSLFRRAEVSRPVWKLDAAGRNVDAFVSQFAMSSGTNPDRIIDIAVLDSGKVAVITARNLSVLSADGSVAAQFEAESQLNAVFADGEDIVVSSHAYKAAGSPHKMDGEEVPRGLKKFKHITANTWELDPEWLDWSTAGTGAQSSCGRLVKSGSYYYVGNARNYYNSPNTSWNADSSGNLLLWSEVFSNAVWQEVGTPIVVTDDSNLAPDGTTTADTISDSDGSVQTYIYQDVEVLDDDQRYAFSLYIKKDTDTTRFPVLQMKLTGGSTEIDVFAHLNTQTGVAAIYGNVGGGAGEVAVESVGSYWRVTLRASNNETGNDNLRCIIHPAYTSTYGGAAEALTGSIVAWGAHLRKTSWNSAYYKSEDEQLIPSDTGSNTDRFRGIYVVAAEDGAAHPTWACNIALSQAGHVTPVGVDTSGRVYLIGPIATIDGTAVTPWRLYRLEEDGSFDREFSLFNNRVLAAALTVDGNILVGGKFTHYGSQKVSRLVQLDEDGVPVDPCCSGGGAAVLPTLTAPAFSPASGSVDPSEVEISVPGYPSAAIFYTTDGSTPTTSSLVYGGPIDMSEFTDPGEVIIKAFAVLENYQNSPLSLAVYTITAKLPDPVFTPGTGANTPVMVAIEIPGHEDAVIYYTTDGSDPDLDSAVYTTAINVTETTTIKAMGVKDGYRNSDIVSSIYAPASYGSGQLPTPVFTPTSGTQPFPVAVNISVPGHASGLTIYYTVDGSTPNYSSPRYEGDPIELTTEATTSTIKAFATKATYSPSELGSKVYTMETLAAPTISPAGPAVELNTSVSITHGVSDTEIYYTTNGDTPTTASTLYSGPFVLSALPTTVKAIAVKMGYQNSAVATKAYTQLAVATPIISPAAGTVAMPLNVSITCATAGASIYYTTNGDTPTTGSTLYSGAFEITDDTTVKAIAVKSNYVNSAVASSFYSDNLIAPTIAPASGSTIPDQTAVTLAQSGNPIGTQIYYTLDGSTPDNTDTLYTVPFLINANMTVKAVCVKSGYDDSSVTTATYIRTTVPTPYVGLIGSEVPPSGNDIPMTLRAALSVALSGATVHYTTNGDTPTTGSPVYSTNIVIDEPMTIKAIARKLGYNNSSVMSETYTLKAATAPTFSPAGGDTAYPQVVQVSSQASIQNRSVVRCTLDGSPPDSTDPVYGQIQVDFVTVYYENVNSGATNARHILDHGNSGAGSPVWANAAGNLKISFQCPEARKCNRIRISLFGSSIGSITGRVKWGNAITSNLPSGGGSKELSAMNNQTTTEYTTDETGAHEYWGLELDQNVFLGTSTVVLVQFINDITITEDTTLKGFAAITMATDYLAPGYADSAVTTEVYEQGVCIEPTFNPTDGGFVPFGGTVHVESVTPGCSIRYTTDGVTEPTDSVGTLIANGFTGGDITIATFPKVIKAIAFKSGFTSSAVVEATIDQQQVQLTFTPTPPASGVVLVTIAADISGSTIYYTLDGSTPDTSSFIYSGPIGISGETTIKAFARKSGGLYLDSDIETAVYNA